VRHTSLETVGALAESTFDAVDVGTAVLGVDGISAGGGATTHDEVEARANTAMTGHARRTVVVCVGAKVGRVTLARVVGAGGVDALVTDASADRAELDRLRAAGVAVHVVEPRR
jgi:DeoR family transcriptional regulator of aga operon